MYQRTQEGYSKSIISNMILQAKWSKGWQWRLFLPYLVALTLPWNKLHPVCWEKGLFCWSMKWVVGKGAGWYHQVENVFLCSAEWTARKLLFPVLTLTPSRHHRMALGLLVHLIHSLFNRRATERDQFSQCKERQAQNDRPFGFHVLHSEPAAVQSLSQVPVMSAAVVWLNHSFHHSFQWIKIHKAISALNELVTWKQGHKQ